jgi:alkyl hydroperoxide reductase subunit AhpC
MIQVGQQVPNFTVPALVGNDEKSISLSDYQGKWVVLFFYPADFTFICPTEVTEFSKRIQEFRALGAVVLGGSTDSIHAHRVWLKEIGELQFPLFADQTHELSRLFGVLLEDQGIDLRGTFIIDPDRKVRSIGVNDLNIGRSVSEIIRLLEALGSGEDCPVDWRPTGRPPGAR